MSLVVSFPGVAPPARYNETPWVSVTVMEAADPVVGPWTTIDTLTLAVDENPAEPTPVNLTTAHGTAANLWYVLTFIDATAAQSLPYGPVQNALDPDTDPEPDVTLPPTPDQIRDASPLLRQQFPEPPTDQYQASDLRALVSQAIGLVESATFRIIDPALGDPSPEGYIGEIVPPALIAVAFDAIKRQSEVLQVTGAADFTQQAATGRRLRGFSAGPYSESYFAPNEFARKGVATRPQMSDDDTLDALLWALATEDARDYLAFRDSGVTPPTGVATAFDYRRQNSGYTAGSLGGWPSPGLVGPDGY